MRRWLAIALCVCLATCAKPSVYDRETFEHWLSETPARADAFARFESVLQANDVADVVPNQELWLVDQLRPRCVTSLFVSPPESEWRNVVSALRIVRDRVKPAIGDVRVVSAYRDETFNQCVGGASRSAHRAFHALDLVPVNPDVTRDDLIEALCAIHRRDGAALHFGLGIYSGRRFHVDGHGYRGWGPDYHSATFPCRG